MAIATRLLAALAVSAVLVAADAQACTRVTYHGPNETWLTGRTFDFRDLAKICRVHVPQKLH